MHWKVQGTLLCLGCLSASASHTLRCIVELRNESVNLTFKKLLGDGRLLCKQPWSRTMKVTTCLPFLPSFLMSSSVEGGRIQKYQPLQEYTFLRSPGLRKTVAVPDSLDHFSLKDITWPRVEDQDKSPEVFGGKSLNLPLASLPVLFLDGSRKVRIVFVNWSNTEV